MCLGRFAERGWKIAGTVQDADDFNAIRRDDVEENVVVENKSAHSRVPTAALLP